MLDRQQAISDERWRPVGCVEMLNPVRDENPKIEAAMSERRTGSIVFITGRLDIHAGGHHGDHRYNALTRPPRPTKKTNDSVVCFEYRATVARLLSR